MTLSSMPSSQRGAFDHFSPAGHPGSICFVCDCFPDLVWLKHGRLGAGSQTVSFFPALWDTAVQLWNYFSSIRRPYLWQKAQVPAFDVVKELFINSAGVTTGGVDDCSTAGYFVWYHCSTSLPKGRKQPAGGCLHSWDFHSQLSAGNALLGDQHLAVVPRAGIEKSTPPSAGFGWDARIILPALVLAARPMAQVMQVTYTTLTDILQQEYIRAARARGIPGKLVILRHAFRNALIPILTTLGTSLRFSLASLPIIEGFFNWRGLGWNLLKAIQSNQAVFVTDLILALGLFFLVINLVLELLYRRIDPRLRRGSRQVEDWEEAGLSSEWGSFLEEIKIVWQDLKAGIKNLLALLAGKPKQISRRRASTQPVFLRREQETPK